MKGFEYLSCLFFSPLDVDLESELDPDPLYNVYADPKHWFSAMAVCYLMVFSVSELILLVDEEEGRGSGTWFWHGIGWYWYWDISLNHLLGGSTSLYKPITSRLQGYRGKHNHVTHFRRFCRSLNTFRA